MVGKLFLLVSLSACAIAAPLKATPREEPLDVSSLSAHPIPTAVIEATIEKDLFNGFGYRRDSVGWGPRGIRDQDNVNNLKGRKNFDDIKEQAEGLIQGLKNMINGLGN